MDFYFAVCGITFHVKSMYSQIFNIAEKFICPATADSIDITVTQADIEREEAESETVWKPELYECAAVMRKVAIAILEKDKLFLHGACIAYNGNGYLFTANSGVGKTTHISMWQQCFGRQVNVINGDKPIVGIEDGRTMIYGSPWMGKERFGCNEAVALHSIVFLKRDTVCGIRKINTAEAMNGLFGQVFLITHPDYARQVLLKLNKIIKNIDFYELSCDISQQAVRCAFETLTEESFDEKKVLQMKLIEGMVVSELGDEFVAVPTGNALQEFKGVVHLNTSGYEIWKGIEKGLTKEEIADGLTKTFTDVDMATALEATEEYMRTLVKEGILKE